MLLLKLIGVVAVHVVGVFAPLPDGCTPLNERTFSTSDPSLIFPANSELQDIVPPSRTGTLRSQGALPTQHFATNQIKPGPAPMRLMPYSATMNNEGITYDAYTLERWNQSTRTDTMQQQTPSRQGAPWDKVLTLGTNMKQLVSGPDGNPMAEFTGRSGIRVGIIGSGEPVWDSFGDNYGNFIFSDTGDGSMEAALVRGAALLTHRFTNANPLLQPYCGSSVNGQAISFSCPAEREVSDPGSGFHDATCAGGTMTITLRTTKAVPLNTVQYAVNTAADWPSSHPMVTCGSECVMSNEGRQVDITVTGASGTMNYALNVVGRYVLPPGDWVNNPAQVQCAGRRVLRSLPRKDDDVNIRPYACASSFCHTPICDIQGATNTFRLTIELSEPISGPEGIQFAVNTGSLWTRGEPMLTCTNPAITCEISEDQRIVTYTRDFPVDTSMKYAVNVIGRFVQPPGDWQGQPFEHVCGSIPETTPAPTIPPTTTAVPEPTASPGFCTEMPNLAPCSTNFCKTTFCQSAGTNQQNFKLVIQLDQEVNSISEVQVAMNHEDDWDQNHGMITCTPELCTLQPDRKSIIYCNTVKTGVVKYAVNIIGRFIQPPTDWETQPFQTQCGGSGTDLGTGTKFVIELDEPRGNLPSQTRKWVAYFSEEVKAVYDANGLNFEPVGGGKFNGLMQLGYMGASPRGDTSGNNVFDAYANVFSYKPSVSFCVQNENGYISFDWNMHDINGPTSTGQLLMVVMPHQESLLQQQNLISTPFGFKGHIGVDWLMQEPLPKAEMEPDEDAVLRIALDNERLMNIMDALDRDTEQQSLANDCVTANSYYAGKSISMVARLASISRAFNTAHHELLDPELGSCLEKWLRIDDTLSDGNKFRYDTVYGGLLLRSGPENEPINPTANFGFPLFSDHHFHLGYWIYALGYYVRHYPSWAQTHRERILLIVRDVANPSRNDTYFPLVRHKDFYLGISWATGVVSGLRQAESSSEAIACYHGVAALGSAYGDDVMKHVGQLTLATEIRSVRHYYHVRAGNSYLFPDILREYGTIGQFAEDAIFYYTLNWPCDPFEFPMRHACLVGIQVIPITAIAKYYQDQEWAGSVYNVCTWANNPTSAPGAELVDPSILRPVTTGWGAFCHSVTSQLNEITREEAVQYVRGLGPNGLVSGTGEASTLLYIYEAT